MNTKLKILLYDSYKKKYTQNSLSILVEKMNFYLT